MTPLLVAIGGAGGVLARYGLTQLISGPWPVVAINLVGSFLLGLLVGAGGVGDQARVALGTGVLGGFTTYSAFTVQVVADLDDGHTGRAVAYLLVSVLGGLACAAAGYAAARAAS